MIVPSFIDKSKLKTVSIRYIRKDLSVVGLKKGSHKKIVIGHMLVPKKEGMMYYVKGSKVVETKMKTKH